MMAQKTATKTATKNATKAAAKKAASKKSAKAKPGAKTKSPKSDGKLSALDAAAKVLGESTEPMTTGAMIEAMATKGYWSSPHGKTPAATLYAAILREIATKGTEARFQKVDRGQFTLRGAVPTAKRTGKAKAAATETEAAADAT